MANRIKLTLATKRALRTSSKSGVQSSFSKLGRHIKSRKWLAISNRYLNDCEENLKTDTKPLGTIKQTDLAQYIAASGPVHCLDGWGFLGRALMCHFAGDGDASRHLGYYAELRAAMSLLATEGIGIFNDRNFVLDAKTSCHKIPSALSTHKITWLALEHWANLKRSADLLGKIVTPGNIPLTTWLNSFGAGNQLQPIGAKWLKMWGLVT